MAVTSAPSRGQRSPHGYQIALLAAGVVIVILLVLLFAVVFRGSPGIGGVRGSGIAASQARALPPFTGLDLAGSNIVNVVAGPKQSVVVHADSNLLSHVTTRVAAGNLVIASTGSFTANSPMSVDVTVPSVSALRLSGSGIMSVRGMTGGALTVTLSGSGILRASGSVTKLNVVLDGSGQAEFYGLTARDVHAVVSGSGLIQVTATRSLSASVPGSGAIIYRGEPPQVTTSITGSGAVTRG